MASRDLKQLVPCVETRAGALLAECKSALGVELDVICTVRSMDESAAIWAQGRAGTPAVNELRRKAGMPPITDAENVKRSNAKPGQSMHNYGLALDVVPIVGGKAEWNNADLWNKIGAIGEKCGLEWAGRWKSFKELDHFQYTGGLTLADIKAGKLPEN